jgi:toxin YhaV
LVVNGWELFYFRLFKEFLDSLDREVTALAEKDPEGFVHHKKTKLLKAVVDNVRIEVPRDPDSPAFRLGKTLGNQHTDWRRVKHHRLPPRYRLFFKFASSRRKVVYAWMDDEYSQRKAGAKTDVYEIFKGLLRRGTVPDSFEVKWPPWSRQ